MRGYSYFADYYDGLTQNVPHEEMADYFCSLFRRLEHAPGLALDLACGTGTLTLALAKRGIDIYGVDASPEMLSVAQQKAGEQETDILFLCQKMQTLDLYGTVDTVLCTLDSVNHLVRDREVQQAFDRVSLFLNPGGYFIFDVNTVYKHREVLGNNTFVYDTKNVFCVWQNTFYPETDKVRINLDFFEREGDAYFRRQEEFWERAYTHQQLVSFLHHAGLTVVERYADFSFAAPTRETQRILYVTRKSP